MEGWTATSEKMITHFLLFPWQCSYKHLCLHCTILMKYSLSVLFISHKPFPLRGCRAAPKKERRKEQLHMGGVQVLISPQNTRARPWWRPHSNLNTFCSCINVFLGWSCLDFVPLNPSDCIPKVCGSSLPSLHYLLPYEERQGSLQSMLKIRLLF